MKHVAILLLLFLVIVPLLAHQDCAFEDTISPEQKRIDRQRMSKDKQQQRSFSSSLCTRCISIDIVFHVIGNSNDVRLWTDAAVDQEVNRINQHFSSTPFRFVRPRVIRTQNNEWANARINNDRVRDDIVASLRVGGPDVANIFVTDGTCQTTGGYATFPFDHGFFPTNQYSMEDYVFICSTYIGKLNNEFHHTIITHELGHWLGLYHTYDGESCDSSNLNDEVDDTPQHKDPTYNDGCGSSPNTCPKLSGRDPVNNFMNSAACADEFTRGQAVRMYGQFNAYRRQVEKCTEDEVEAVFEVRFDSKPDDMAVSYAEYTDGDRDWTNLKKVDSEPHVNYANQVFRRELCLSKQTMYSFTVQDTAEDGFDAPGYSSLTIQGRQIARETVLEDEWTATFVVADSCASGQSLLTLDLGLYGDGDEISWRIRRAGTVMVDRSSTNKYLEEAYNRFYFEKCLSAGDYDFTIYDSAGNGMYGDYKLKLAGREILSGGGFAGFRSSESTSFKVSVSNPVYCFSGSSTVNVKGRGTIEIRTLEIGDLIHVEADIYEPVYSFGHYQADARTPLLQIQTSDHRLEISEDHMIYTQDRGPIPAGLLAVGDEILDANHNTVTVESISAIVSQGVFAPFTVSGNLDVGGILVSSYIAMEQSPSLTIGPFQVSYQWLAHTFEFPHRTVCGWYGCGGETYDDDGINTWMPLTVVGWIMKQNAVLKQLLLLVVLFTLLLFHCLESFFKLWF
jgi:hypothetical protein